MSMNAADGTRNRAWLARFLRDRDERCPGCGEGLRGLEGESCPSCRQELVLSVGLVEPKLGEFIAGLMGLLAGFGFCAFVQVWLIIAAIRGEPAPGPEFWWPLMGGVLVLGGGAWWWVVGRPRFRRLERGARFGLIVLAYGVSTVFVVGFLLVVYLGFR